MTKKKAGSKPKLTKQDLAKQHEERVRLAGIVLSLLYLTSWREGEGDYSMLRSWKSYDWDAMDMLYDAGLIEGKPKNKSVWLTREGEDLAREMASTLTLDTEWLGRIIPFVEPVPAEGQRAYRLNVRFDFDELTCWRELVVPAGYSFFDLHLVLQTVFNWLDHHVYDFKFDIDVRKFLLGEVRCFGPGFFDDACNFEGRELLNVEEVTLSDVFERTASVRYIYDWGDDWNLSISRTETLDAYRSADPTCTDGEGDNPPDDVGGEGGFEEFLRVMGDKDNPDYQYLVQWGEGQGFEHFDAAAVNERMHTWRPNKALHMHNCRNEERPLTGTSLEEALTHTPKLTLIEGGLKTDEEDGWFDYEKYEQECAKRMEENAVYLGEFQGWLGAMGLKQKTIDNHFINVEFYLNTYLLYGGAHSMQEGCSLIDDYLGYFFIRKCAWSTPATIRSTATSIKKFYQCMRERGHISVGDYNEVKRAIKEGMPRWQEECEIFNSGGWSGY